jgi:hypothetical protein
MIDTSQEICATTSCFDIIRIVPARNTVSIAGYAPDWYTGRQFRKLAPKRIDYDAYKISGDEYAYTQAYKAKVLDLLDPREVLYEQIGVTATILCWELPGLFCHRRLFAQWIEDRLEITIPELTLMQAVRDQA